MKPKQTLNLLLIALFVWAFQSTTIHFKHHIIDKVSKCNLCDSYERNNLYHHSSTVVIDENLAIKTRKREEKIVVRSRFDYAAMPECKSSDIVEYRGCIIEPIPLGYFSTAPPKIS